MKHDKYIAEYEAEIGRKASKAERRFAELLSNIEAKFEAKGREDGDKWLPAPGSDAFSHWANNVIDNAELAETIADLMQMAYMEGYEGGAAA